MKKLEFLIIDPQNDFCHKDGSLSVPRADGDLERLAEVIKRLSRKITDIHVTLDSHHYFDISHPVFWINSVGEHPSPITVITKDDMKNGTWRTTVPTCQNRKSMESHGLNRDGAKEYLEALETGNRYPHCIWPPHCLIGSWGFSIFPVLYEVISNWEKEVNGRSVNFVTKGSNFMTEHFSGIMAEVPDPQDPSTQLNTKLIETLQDADIIALSGQALSHCVANTVRDIANNFGEENIKKFVLIKDTTSSVPGFENVGEDFVTEMVGRGMQISTSKEFFV